jgi:hypothetical protein
MAFIGKARASLFFLYCLHFSTSFLPFAVDENARTFLQTLFLSTRLLLLAF